MGWRFAHRKGAHGEKSLWQNSQFRGHMDRNKTQRQITGTRAWKEQNSAAGGLLYDLGPHLVDQTLYVFGKPNTIHANILHQRDRTSINNDFFSITLDYT